MMTMPQPLRGYEALAVKVAKMEKNFEKRTGKIFEILNKLAKLKMKRGKK